MIIGFDWVTNYLEIVLQGMNQGIKLMIQCLVKQVSFLCHLEKFIGLAKHATPSVLSRIESLRCQVVLSGDVLPRVHRWHSDDFVDCKLQLVATVFCGQDGFTS